LKHVIVRAGAGAGKTRGLIEAVEQYYRDFRANSAGSLPRIYLTTFTRKAAQELRERLVLRACEIEDPDFLRFVSDASHLNVSTIQGMFRQFLSQVGHLAGVDSGFQLVDETEALRLNKRVLRALLLEDSKWSSWLEPYPFERLMEMCRLYQQAKWENASLRPARFEDLEQILHKRKDAWRERLTGLAQQILEHASEAPWQEFARQLQMHEPGWGSDLPSAPRGRSQESLKAMVKDLKKAYDKEWERSAFNPETWTEALSLWEQFVPLGEAFSEQLKALKDQQALLELSDLELKTWELLREKPFLAEVFSESWDIWMIDEYQDTSPIQVACLDLLIGEHPRYLVGDPQQSIYLFRGADVQVFERAETWIREHRGEHRELLRNYRSESDLLLWINDVMKGLSSQFVPLDPRSEPVSPPQRTCAHLCRAVDLEGEIRGLVAHVGVLVQAGARFDQICVLGRTNQVLIEVARKLKSQGFPTRVHASAGFSSRREVIDARALWRFLINPHDNLNLLTLLRSPWFFVEDGQLAKWMERRPQSLWQTLSGESGVEALDRLRRAVNSLRDYDLPRVFETALCESGMLDFALIHDPAGRKESNLWKLIQNIRNNERTGGLPLLDLMSAQAEDGESRDGDAVSAQEPNCINLMTIHGAKGLQFEHVLIPGLGQIFGARTREALTVSEDLFAFPLMDREEGTYPETPLDVVVSETYKTQVREEYDRLMYVALTRAKSTLFLSCSDVSVDSWASRIRAFREEVGVYESTHYRYTVEEPIEVAGSEAPRWGWQTQPVRAPWRLKASWSAESEAGAVSGVGAVTGATTDPSLAAYASDGIGDEADGEDSGGEDSDGQDFHGNNFHGGNDNPRGNSETSLRRWQAQNFGTRLHLALEALKYGQHPSDEELSKAVNYVLQHQAPPLAEILKNGRVEWGFQIQREAKVTQGRIDLWGVVDKRIYIVDYKSGSPERKEDAFEQLQGYAIALRQFGHSYPIELVVVYPLHEIVEVRPFEDAPT